VSLRRIDGHALWANLTALRRAGLTAEAHDPEGGRIVRDARGEPSGVLIDNAMQLVTRLLPRRDAAACARDLLAGQARMLVAGALRVHDMDIHDTLAESYRALAEKAALALDLRVYAGAETKLAAELLRSGPRRIGPRLLFAGIKLYADGALGSRGAALLAPYDDAPGERGLRLWDDKALRELLAASAAAGLQIAAHAIGDDACRQLLDQFRALGDAPRRLRWRIEHAQTVSPEDLPRFAAQGIIASVQPGHAVGDCAWAGARLGAARLRTAYAYRSLLESGATLAGGSDAPIDDEAPLHGLHAACLRQTLGGEPPGGFLPEEKLTPLQALRIYTQGIAAAEGDPDGGALRAGGPADFTVVDRDVIADPSAAATANILGVYRAGVKVEVPPAH
jgi:predicted amidohydrolase YtcJ